MKNDYIIFKYKPNYLGMHVFNLIHSFNLLSEILSLERNKIETGSF
jgi:hypothetical protein